MPTSRLAWTLAGLAALLPVDRQVDVGGHALHVRTLGDDGPTVVFESALGEGLGGWDAILKPLSAEARVVAYDRAGIDRSEPSDAPRTPTHVASELAALLTAIEAEPPYILVGHSAGGLYVRAFAARYPEQVAGLLLVDATPERLAPTMRALDARAWDEEESQLVAYFEQPPADGPPTWWHTARLEWLALRAFLAAGESEQARELPATLPHVPAVVLTALQLVDEPESVTQTAEGVEAWHALHAAWVAGHPNALHVVTRHSGHHIQHDQPALVLAALRELLRVVRDGGPLDVGPVRAAAQPIAPASPSAPVACKDG